MRVISNSELGFDGIAITALAQPERAGAKAQSEAAALYVWSDGTGLWAKRAAVGARAVRLAERCRGGIAATTRETDAFVACSRTLVDPQTPETEVVVYRVGPDLRASLMAEVGQAGRDGRGVAIAVDAQAVYVAFHDGSIGEQTIVLASVPVSAHAAEGALRHDAVHTTRLSRVGQVASEPAVIAHGGHVYTAFTELELTTNGEPASTVWLSRDGARARVVARPRAYSPTPKLAADALGLVLSYRDKSRTERRNGTRSELYVVRLDDRLKLLGKARGVGRANTEGEPSVLGCGSLTTALLPREYGGERFVGINALDGELDAVGAGHQLYATGREFVHASGVCLEAGTGSWLLFAADRAAPGKPGSEAVSLRFSCKQ
ncbi:MAG: hypothetical protein JWN04_3999 [Myxococcaceae bacterium]|nr:hypothetical protein [Myxococcaceae bacterium]